MFVRLHALQGASSKDYQKDQSANVLTGSEKGSNHSKHEKMAARNRCPKHFASRLSLHKQTSDGIQMLKAAEVSR
jgi:hypothetical protein